ncbi:hypothetical protein [Kushneria phosphatilytica]|uniref:Uncharacterized protein n=1 Tax=Kushneria phosphatilytica TaxID=657387 RepID=A0A1S1NUI8_9GAMM|nr:hypothetical protein [Kushneria phosphatilytica]OHV08419.1 hypothetical protein BH688_14025 [Kushneria phosphatilytica]QEL09844.1 hypothetical protein FY550_00985 [Kushneria phosphatilytica]
MLPSFRSAQPHHHGRLATLLAAFTRSRAERIAHRRLLEAASAFIEEPGVNRLERLQAAVRYSQFTLEPEDDD